MNATSDSDCMSCGGEGRGQEGSERERIGGKGREGKGREGKGREGKGRGGEGRGGKGRGGEGRGEKGGDWRENGKGGVDSDVQLLVVNVVRTTIHSIAWNTCIQWESSCSQLTTPQMPHSTLTWAHACSLQQHLSHTEEADNMLSSQKCTEETTHTL